MWNQLRNDVIERFDSVEAYFKATGKFRGDLAQASKGWAFVHVFSAYEFTVKSAMRTSIDAINTQRHTMLELQPRLMALFLDSYLVSVKECDQKEIWKRRIALFEQIFRTGPATLPNSIFPKDHHKEGKQFRPHQLQLIFEIFGVPSAAPRMVRYLHRISELVDTRNTIAHGMDTADAVGRRFSRNDIKQRLTQIKRVCLLFIKALETQCSNPDFQKRPS